MMLQCSLSFLLLGCTLMFCHAQSTSCGQTIITEDAIITSPGYPSRYSNSLDCTWYISKVGDYKVKVNFTDFNTESNYDFVKVYDYFGNAYRLPINSNDSRGYSGRLSPFFFISTENKMRIRFMTDGSVTRQGFRATISFVQMRLPTAPTPITIPSGEQRVINYTSYSNRTEEHWAFSNSNPDGILTITTTRLSLSYNSYLEIRDGNTSDSDVIARFQRTSLVPGPIFSSSGYIWIRLRSAGDTWNSFHFSVATGCYSKLNSIGGTIASPRFVGYNRSLQCEWKIHKPSNTSRLTLYLNYLTGEPGSNFLLVRNSTGAVLNRFSGSANNAVILTSSDDELTVQFNTTGQNNSAFNLTYSRDCPLNYSGGYFVGDRHYRGRATLVCYPGYYLASSHSVASCGYRGYWSYPTAWCRRLQLPYLSASRNGTFISGSSVTIRCTKYNSVVSTLELINEDTGVVYDSASGRYYNSLRHTFNNLRVNDSGVYRCRETINGTVMDSNAVASITVESCNQDLTEDGIISSPGYPTRYYGNNLNCTWNVFKEGNYQIQLKFLHFSLSGYTDCLYTIDHYNNNFRRTYTQYSRPLNTTIRYKGNKIQIRFLTDSYRTALGFSLNISFIPIVIPDAVAIPNGQQRIIRSSQNISSSIGSQQWVFENSDQMDIFTITINSMRVFYPNSIEIRDGNSVSSRVVAQINGVGRREPIFVQSSTVWIVLRIDNAYLRNEFEATVTAGCYATVNVTDFGYIRFPYNFASQSRNLSCQWRAIQNDNKNVVFYLQYLWSDIGDVLYATNSSGSVLNSQSGSINISRLFFRTDDNDVTIHFNTNGRKNDVAFNMVYSKDCTFPNVTGGYFIGDRHYGGVATLICQEDYILTSFRNTTTCNGRTWSYPIPSCQRWYQPLISASLPTTIYPGFSVTVSCRRRNYRSRSVLQLVNSEGLPAQASSTNSYYYYSQRRFVFSRIRVEDSGNYRCKETINGRVKYSNTLSIDVTPCTWNITQDGSISSPGYPSNYPNNLECVWNLHKEGSYRVNLTFADFYLYPYGDYVYVYDYVNNNNNGEYRLMNSRYTGRKYSSFSLKSTGNKMKVRFTSNSYYANRGFSAQVKFESTQPRVSSKTPHIGIITQALGQRFMDSVQAVYVLFTKVKVNATHSSFNF